MAEIPIRGCKGNQMVSMIKGELETKTVNARELLKKSDDNTLLVPMINDKSHRRKTCD
jgi:hypothetical protein